MAKLLMEGGVKVDGRSTRGGNRGNNHTGGKSGFIGVIASNNGAKWMARFSVTSGASGKRRHKLIHIGMFNTKEEAAFAYDEAVRKHRSAKRIQKPKKLKKPKDKQKKN